MQLQVWIVHSVEMLGFLKISIYHHIWKVSNWKSLKGFVLVFIYLMSISLSFLIFVVFPILSSHDALDSLLPEPVPPLIILSTILSSMEYVLHILSSTPYYLPSMITVLGEEQHIPGCCVHLLSCHQYYSSW